MQQIAQHIENNHEGDLASSSTVGHRSTMIDFHTMTPRRDPGSLFAPGLPEISNLKFGILPLTDSAPIVVAHEKGFFTKFGIESNIEKHNNWSAIRDAVTGGAIHGAHMMFGMPIAAAVGKLGRQLKPLIIPWILCRNGQGITLAMKHRELYKSGPADLRSYARQAMEKGRPMVFGITLQPGSHAMWLRYWLASGGIDPDKDVALITVPPQQMVENMRAERMDGFCVGDPWNARAEEQNLGFTAAYTEDVWPDHPEKVLAFTEEFAEQNPRSIKAVLQALDESSAWCDARENHEELSNILAKPEYLNCPASLIQKRLVPEGRKGVTFRARNTNYPQLKYGVWWLSQLRRWTMLVTPPDYVGVVNRVLRPEFYEAAMQELGNPQVAMNLEPELLCDGKLFKPQEPEQYAKSFPITHCRS